MKNKKGASLRERLFLLENFQTDHTDYKTSISKGRYYEFFLYSKVVLS